MRITAEDKVRYRLNLLLAAAAALALAVLAGGFAAASGDDFFRAVVTRQWSQAPSVHAGSLYAISVLWLPLHFWAAGSLYLLTHQLVLSLTAISLVSFIACLAALYHLTRLFFGERAGLVAVLLAAVLPAHVWLAVSMAEMTWYYAAVTGGCLWFARWQRGGRAAHLLAASACFLLTTMLRPEGWVFAVLFSACVAWDTLIRREPGRGLAARFAAVVLPGVFIIFWLVRNWVDYGDALYFLHYSKGITQAHVNIRALSPAVKALEYPFFMFIASPILFLLTAAGVVALRRHADRAMVRHAVFALAQLAAMSLAGMYGAGTKALPQRYVLANVILLTPFAAALLVRWWERGRWRWLAAAVLAAHTAVCGVKAFQSPPLYREIVRAGKAIGASRPAGTPDARICSELAFRKLAGLRLPAEKDFLILASAHVALMVYAGDPDAVLFDTAILAEKPQLIRPDAGPAETSRERMDDLLREHGVGWIVLESREAMALVPPAFRLARMVGSTAVFARGVVAAPAFESGNVDAVMRPLDLSAAPGIRLTGAGVSSRLAPRVLSLCWQADPGAAVGREWVLRMSFVKAGRRTAERSFEREVPPVLNWVSSGRVIDNVPLTLPSGFPPGAYAPTIWLQGADGGAAGERVELPPVAIVSSKREVLVDFLTGRSRDWRLLARTLLSL